MHASLYISLTRKCACTLSAGVSLVLRTTLPAFPRAAFAVVLRAALRKWETFVEANTSSRNSVHVPKI